MTRRELLRDAVLTAAGLWLPGRKVYSFPAGPIVPEHLKGRWAELWLDSRPIGMHRLERVRLGNTMRETIPSRLIPRDGYLHTVSAYTPPCTDPTIIWVGGL